VTAEQRGEQIEGSKGEHEEGARGVVGRVLRLAGCLAVKLHPALFTPDFLISDRLRVLMAAG
jgi:hypothetical protein